MKMAPMTAEILTAILLALTFLPLSPQQAFAQARANTHYSIQPISPGHPVVGVPGGGFGYNPGFAARAPGSFAPAYTYSVPQVTPNGSYLINGNNFWRADSGYYYPWSNNSAYGQIIYAPQPNQAPAAQAPPLSTAFSDLIKYLDQKKQQGQITNADYQHLRRRATDLQTKYFSLRTAAEGNIDPGDESQIRRDLDELGAEVSKSVQV